MFEAPGNVVCIVMRAENNPGAPTAFEVFEKGINVPTKVGVVPNPGMAHAGVPYIITYTGLVKGTEYHAYCAQGNELVTNRVSFTTATVLDDTSIVHNTGDSVTLRTSYSKDGVARCIILDHGDPSPTADDILNGETNGVSYVGSYPPSSYQTASVPHIVVYDKLTPGLFYDAYCASSTLSSSDKTHLTFQTLNIELMKISANTDTMAVTATIKASHSGEVRCVAFKGRYQNNVTYNQVLFGIDADAMSEKVTILGDTHVNISVPDLTPNYVYDVYCGMNNVVSSRKKVSLFKAISEPFVSFLGATSVQISVSFLGSVGFRCAIFNLEDDLTIAYSNIMHGTQ